MYRLFFLVCLVVINTTRLHAQDTPPSDTSHRDWIGTPEWRIEMALGYGEIETPIALKQTQPFSLLPQLAIYGEQFFFENGLFGFAEYESTSNQFDWVIYPNDDGLLFHLSKDSSPLIIATPFPIFSSHVDILKSPERAISTMAGWRYSHRFTHWQFVTQLGHDVSGEHNGWEVGFKFSRASLWHWRDWQLDTDLGLMYKSQELVNYYYQPQFGEIAPLEGDLLQICDNNVCRLETVGPFRAHHGWRAQASLNLHYSINQDWSFSTVYRHFYLSDSMMDTPLLTTQHYAMWFAGVQYGF